MPNIPTIPGTSQIPDQQIGVKRDARPLLQRQEAVGQAFRQGASTVEEAAGVVMDYEQRKHEAKESAIFNQSAILMQSAQQAHLEQLKHAVTDQQIAAVVPTWQEIASNLKNQQINNQDLGPNAKLKLGQQFDTWAGSSTASFQAAADSKDSTRRKSIAIQAAESFMATGEERLMPNAKAALQSAVDHGDMYQEEADFYIGKMPERLAENQAQNAIDANPYRAQQDLKNGAIKITNPNKLRILTTEAGERPNAMQGTNLQNYMAQVQSAANPLAYPSDEELTIARDSGLLSARGFGAIQNLKKKTDLKGAEQNFNILMADMSGVQLSSENDPQATIAKWKEDAAAVHDPVLQKRAMDAIGTQQKALEKKVPVAEPPAVRAELNYMKEDFDRGTSFLTPPAKGDVVGGTGRVAGMPDDKFAAAYPGRRRQDVIDETRANYGKKVAQFMAWAKDPANKDKVADPEQVAAERRRLEAPDIAAQVNAALLAP